ncbi:aminopeptidase N [Methylonatrum kenyense]|uniref:aminopeptidase N n=1 Tax=Methylonatrum kenyense TaxID=455253 RepID=UPI0020C13844|nr:aminopeptidase N [Methylonatrum kenyense]MCK8516416.1 aminopeptidase N [Methylonatrum kenyense]
MADAHARPQTVLLADYREPDHLVDTVELRFELQERETIVFSRLRIRSRDGRAGLPLRLDGQELELLELRLDGEPLAEDRWRTDELGLSIDAVPADFELAVTTRIHPEDNTALEGLYRSGDLFCTQCEAEGFRRITYYPDRPDVMAVFTTTVVADPGRFPILLSNGDLVEDGRLEDGRHFARWHDPYPKPSYLFALVAGDLHLHEDHHVTPSGRDVTLRLYVEHRNAGRTDHAMQALKDAMRWDEQTYGLEYDLDTYMVVAVDDFNMGAMENKGLNVFNTVCVLADPETSTDQDFTTVEAVIAHEYFHNWTGNRVTCRDWFQLSLKEGLTVYREHQFCADMHSADVQRINEVRLLRTAQFPEDAGPMAHPVRPERYAEISNFYTPTVYNKGAEVIRMYRSLLGEAGYQRGIELYFRRHDGQAVTCDDFRAAMADANDADLEQFGLWYSQAGTPLLTVRDRYDPETGRYSLQVRQECPDTPGQADKQAMHMPLTLALLDQTGGELPLKLTGEQSAIATERVLELRDREHVFEFLDIPERPVPSLLRGFSAPVRLDYPWNDEQLAFLMAHDNDGFCRWDAGQQLAMNVMLRAWDSGQPVSLPESLSTAVGSLLDNAEADPSLAAETLMLPSETVLAEQREVVDVEAIHRVREELKQRIHAAHEDCLLAVYRAMDEREFSISGRSMGRRALRNLCLDYLMTGEQGLPLAVEQYRTAATMTEQLGALALLCHQHGAERDNALQHFAERWADEPLVMNKWFRVQAMSEREDAPELVEALLRHPAFTLRNPNRVRSLIGAFAQGNPLRFHGADGKGYRLLADNIIALNDINPQVAARVLLPLTRWRRQDEKRQAMMREQLERIGKVPTLSKDVQDVVDRSLRT